MKTDHPIIKYAAPLLAFILAIVITYFVYSNVHVTHNTDGWILVGIGSVYLFSSATILVFTRQWELRSLGQTATYFADALLYLGLGLGILGFTGGLQVGQQDFIRSLFTVGGAAIVIGVHLWYIRRRKGRTSDGNEVNRPDIWATKGKRGSGTREPAAFDVIQERARSELLTDDTYDCPDCGDGPLDTRSGGF